MRLLWRLKKGTKLSDAEFVRRYHEQFLGVSGYGNSREREVGGIRFGAPLCHKRKDERNE
jgi:hypothetical protein